MAITFNILPMDWLEAFNLASLLRVESFESILAHACILALGRIFARLEVIIIGLNECAIKGSQCR